MKILIVEGLPQLGEHLKRSMEERGYMADVAHDGVEGKALATKHHYRGCVLDAQLTGMEYLALLRAIRYRRSFPILVVTARDRPHDRMNGFHSGADDFLVKPFSFSQLWGRLRALMSARFDANYLCVGDLELSLVNRVCVRGRTRVKLTNSEFVLLVELMRRRGQVISRSMLAQRLWERFDQDGSNVIDVTIHRLRSKIDDDFDVKLLHTVRSMGYVLEDRSA